MKTITMKILGKPIAKARMKFFRRGNHVGAYDPQDKVKNDIALLAQQTAQTELNGKPFKHALEVTIDCFFEPPKSASKKQLDLMLTNTIRHIKRPDCTNIAKFYEDAFNGVLWRDDSQIAKITIRKWYGEVAKTIITIQEIEEE